MDHLLVEDLPRLGSGLRQDRAAELGICIEIRILALIDEPDALPVEHHAVQIAEPVAAIGKSARRELAPVGADRRGVATAPLSPGQCPDRKRHAQTIALVVRRAADLRRTDQRADMLRAHLHIRLEPAAAEHDRLAGYLLDT